MTIDDFREFLTRRGLSPNSVNVYCAAAAQQPPGAMGKIKKAVELITEHLEARRDIDE